MKPTLPLVSIIVPVHDGARTLPATLQAIAASDLPREMWELIVVDDASTDDTAMLSAQYADCVVRHLVDRGVRQRPPGADRRLRRPASQLPSRAASGVDRRSGRAGPA